MNQFTSIRYLVSVMMALISFPVIAAADSQYPVVEIEVNEPISGEVFEKIWANKVQDSKLDEQKMVRKENPHLKMITIDPDGQVTAKAEVKYYTAALNGEINHAHPGLIEHTWMGESIVPNLVAFNAIYDSMPHILISESALQEMRKRANRLQLSEHTIIKTESGSQGPVLFRSSLPNRLRGDLERKGVYPLPKRITSVSLDETGKVSVRIDGGRPVHYSLDELNFLLRPESWHDHSAKLYHAFKLEDFSTNSKNVRFRMSSFNRPAFYQETFDATNFNFAEPIYAGVLETPRPEVNIKTHVPLTQAVWDVLKEHADGVTTHEPEKNAAVTEVTIQQNNKVTVKITVHEEHRLTNLPQTILYGFPNLDLFSDFFQTMPLLQISSSLVDQMRGRGYRLVMSDQSLTPLPKDLLYALGDKGHPVAPSKIRYLDLIANEVVQVTFDHGVTATYPLDEFNELNQSHFRTDDFKKASEHVTHILKVEGGRPQYYQEAFDLENSFPKYIPLSPSGKTCEQRLNEENR